MAGIISLESLYNSTVSNLTRDPYRWMSFLDTAARLYKYSFPDAALIYAQRPNAKACAGLALWNRLGRRIRAGSKGIAVFNNGQHGDIRYLFDVADTVGEAKTYPRIWTLDENNQAVLEAWAAKQVFEKENERLPLVKNLANIIETSTNELYDGYYKELSIGEDSLLIDMQDSELRAAFAETIRESAVYTALSRCGLQEELEWDFEYLMYFNSASTIETLATATNEISKDVLISIETEIKRAQKERRTANEHHGRDHLQAGRGRAAAQSGGIGDGAQHQPDQIRIDAASVPEREFSGQIQLAFHTAEADAALPGDREPGAGDEGHGDGTAARGTPAAGEDGLHGERPVQLHDQRHGGRDRDPGDRLREVTPGELPNSIKEPQEAEELKTSAFSLGQDEIDAELTRGSSGVHKRKYRIHEYYKAPRDIQDAVSFLKKEYGIEGHSHTYLNGHSGFVDYSAKGLRFRNYGFENEITVSWINVHKCLTELIAQNRYLNGEEPGLLPEYGREEAGEQPASFVSSQPNEAPPLSGLSLEAMNEYNTIRERYPDYIIAFQVGAYYEIYGDDARVASDILKTKIISRDWPVGGTVNMTGFLTDVWVAESHQLWAAGNNVLLFEYEDIENLKLEHVIAKKLDVADYIPVGNTIEEMRVAALHEHVVNYRITDDNLGQGGAKTKYRQNIDAIRLVKEIEAGNRLATREEQDVLARYAGWGGIPQAFDPDNASWAKEYAELKELLTGEEYSLARASTLNAHYTSPTVIRAIYETVGNMGFSTGNILEPACGVGNFMGLLPDSMAESRLYGVELDSITGRIAKQLYPDADIRVCGFESTDFEDNTFDVAVGNVPFGSYKVADKRYDKYNLLIHDYFFMKTLDKVRTGGIVAFVTSKGTLDKANPEVRKLIAQRAELLGAVRLPCNAFLANAGTQVTTDILFLKKREEPVATLPEWVYVEQTDDGIPLNHYYLEHPEMLLGTMAFDDRMYGNGKDTTLLPIPGADLAAQLRGATRNIQGEIGRFETSMEAEEADTVESIPADPSVRNYSYALKKDILYFREGSRMNRVKIEGTVRSRILGMIQLRDCTRELIDAQLHDLPDETIEGLQRRLNSLYDDYTGKYGMLNGRGSKLAFDKDASYPLLCSLEVLDEEKKNATKAEIFTKRTVRPYRPITHVDTPAEALAVSLAEKAQVDIAFMAGLCGGTPDDVIAGLQGVIYKNPLSDLQDRYAGWETAGEYLSGNVRQKLAAARSAAEGHPEYQVNVDELAKVQPENLEAVDIEVRLGSTWIEPDDVDDFVTHLLQPGPGAQPYINVRYSRQSGNWRVEGKGHVYGNIRATETYGTRRMSALEIIDDSLNLRTSQVYDLVRDPDGKERRVLNQEETIAAQQKQTVIQNAFKDWIWEDAQRRERLVRKYNDMFNNIRPRSYDGSHIAFAGMNPELALRKHQQNAVARILYGGNTLLAHEVGAGKTFTMVAAAQEAKRIGLTQKTLIAVPNHLTGQWAAEYLRLYPAANILVATERDFDTHRRKTFCARIATGDFDAVIMGHSQLLKIPMSIEWQRAFIQDQVNDLMDGILEAKQERAEAWSIKQMERTRKSLSLKLEKLNDTARKDNVIDFEQLGIDRIMIDESDEFKNLLVQTKMRNVAGIGQAESQRASDLYMKGKYIDKITGGRGVTFATGTPISNTLSEMYTLQRYLQYGDLCARGLEHFDSWVSVYADTRTVLELAPSGKGYRTKTRLATFHNLPELTAMFAEFADVQTAEMLNLPVPRIKGGKVETVALKPSAMQVKLVDGLVELTERIRAGRVDPRVANMLSVTIDGRKLALDQRLIDLLLPDDPGSKTNACAERAFRIWFEKRDERLTQLIFCDLSTPGNGGYNVYGDLKNKLIAMGIPEEEIAFVHDAKTDVQKEILFGKVRSGKVRILMGSTARMGAGTNVQRLLYAVHDLDCPWRPRDLTQRHGRILRQGNTNEEVEMYRYVTEGTFDSYNYQILENKQRFISQIMTNKPPARRMDDIDQDTLSYAEVKAIASGNPKIKDKMNLDLEIVRLQMLKNQHRTQQYRLEEAIRYSLPQQIKNENDVLRKLKDDRTAYAPHKVQPFSMTLQGITFSDKDKAAAGDGLRELAKQVTDPDRTIKAGTYCGFDVGMRFDAFHKKHYTVLQGALAYPVEMGESGTGLIQRLDNALHGLDERIEQAQERIQQYTREAQDAVVEKAKPFPYEQELTGKLEQVAALNIELSLDKPDKPVVLQEEDEIPEAEPLEQQRGDDWER